MSDSASAATPVDRFVINRSSPAAFQSVVQHAIQWQKPNGQWCEMWWGDESEDDGRDELKSKRFKHPDLKLRLIVRVDHREVID